MSNGKKSKYQKKMRLKAGKGPIDPRWMWWIEHEDAPKRRVMSLPEAIARSRS